MPFDSSIFRTIVDNMPDSVLVVDSTSIIEYANPAASELFGYAFEELVPSCISKLLPPKFRDSHKAQVRDYAEAPHVRQMGIVEVTGLHKDGHVIPLDIKLTPINQGKRQSIMANIRDISHIRRAEQRLKDFSVSLQDINGKLAILNDEKNKFLGIAAHDLRSPLSVIMGYAKILANENAFGVDERMRLDLVSKIGESSQNMLHMVEELLDIAAIESGKVALNLGNTDLVKLLRNECEANRALAGQKRIEIQFSSPDGMPCLQLDQAKIGQVINNLITNAIKYSPSDTVVKVACKQVNSGIELSVADQGQGISNEDQRRLFQPFAKASSTPTGGEKSTGLGLAIVKRITNAHGGSLSLTSSLGAGSTFFVWLPLN